MGTAGTGSFWPGHRARTLTFSNNATRQCVDCVGQAECRKTIALCCSTAPGKRSAACQRINARLPQQTSTQHPDRGPSLNKEWAKARAKAPAPKQQPACLRPAAACVSRMFYRKTCWQFCQTDRQPSGTRISGNNDFCAKVM